GGGYGGTYGSTYSGYGGYGSGYGGGAYGSRYGMSGGYYGGAAGGRPFMPGMGPGNGEDPENWSSGLEASTRSTFHVLEQIVNAFGGFAQMLDSTFQATHSSFMAMMGMAEQLGVLRNYLGQVLSIFALARTVRNLGYRATGRSPPVNPQELSPRDFAKFQKRSRFSLKPLVVFILVVVGLPYLMLKLIRKMSESQRKRQLEQGGDNNGQGLLPPAGSAEPVKGPDGAVASTAANALNPAQLEFAQALYDFAGEPPVELSFKRGTIIAILNKADAQGQPSAWWRGRLRTGQVGYFPANYVEIIQKQP
ncbi:Peroxin 13, N-terminal region-domain-containing protein, partial [Dimargaris cristalligena]